MDKRIRINSKYSKNQFVMPPLVSFNWGNDKGYETVDRAKHYGLRAKGGAGLVVVEAAAINRAGKITDTQLGIWEDGHIEQYKKIAYECKKYDSLVITQIVNAGRKSIGNKLRSASDGILENKEYKAMTLSEIDRFIEDNVNAAIRMEKAGMDGVEIHGAHGYLLNQFTSSLSNNRKDKYGNSLENRSRLAIEVVRSIKQVVSKDFIIAYRFGVNDSSFKEDIYLAKELEKEGVDFLNVSMGILDKDIKVPEDFPMSMITYMGVYLKDFVNIPLACVYGIKEGDQAKTLIEDYKMDLVAIGRGFLADPNWGIKAIENKKIDKCLDCSGGCRFRIDGFQCPYSSKW